MKQQQNDPLDLNLGDCSVNSSIEHSHVKKSGEFDGQSYITHLIVNGDMA